MTSIASSSQYKFRALLPPWLADRWGVVGIASIAYALIHILWTQFHWGDKANIGLIGNLAMIPPIFLDIVMSWRVARERRLEANVRRTWFLFGLATLLFLFGEIIWAYLSSSPDTVPFPSIADLFLLIPYPLLLWGVISLPGARLDSRERVLFWFNLLLMMTTATMFIGYFLIVPTELIHHTTFLTRALAVAYPMGDLILLSGVLSLLLRLPEDQTRAVLRLLLIGLIFFVTSDLAYGYAGLDGTYEFGTLMDSGWVLAKVFMVLAALRQLYQGPLPPKNAWWIRVLQGFVGALPALAILMGFGLMVYIGVTNFDESVEWILVMGALLSLLTIARQVLLASFSANSMRKKLILTFLLISISSVELVSTISYFAIRTHPNSAWQVFSTATLTVIGLAIGAAIFLAKGFVAPIARLTLVARQIAGGNFTARAQIESADEIGTLAGSFNTMLDTLSQTSEELHRAEAFTYSIFRSLKAHVAVLNCEGEIISVNQAWEMFSCENGAPDLQRTCVGVNYLEVLQNATDDPEVARVFNGLNGVLNRSQTELVVEYPCHSPTEKRWFLMNATPLQSPQGGAVVSHTNITELKLAQQALEESEERYRQLVDYSPDMIAIHDSDKFTFINRAGARLLGVSSVDEVIGQPVMNIVPPQKRELAKKAIEHSLTSQEPTTLLQQTFQRMNGSNFDAEFTVIPILSGRKPAIQLVMRDVTERKRLEEQWQKFKMGIEQSTDAVFMTDVDGTIRYINPAFEKLYGYFWDEAVGQTPRILKSGKLTQEAYQHFWERLLAKGTVAGEIVNRTKDGRLLDIEGSNNPILDEQGNLTGFLSVHRDVTERTRTEERIKHLLIEVEHQKGQLEIRVEERTAELNLLNLRLQGELAERQRLVQSLREHERQLAQSATLAKIAYSELDLITNELTFNDQFYHLLRTTAEKVGGYHMPAERYLHEFVHPDDARRVFERIQFAKTSTARTGQLEYRCICGDGELQNVLIEYEVEFDDHGRPSRVFNAHVDVTERQQLIESLRESEQQFRLLFAASPDAILLIDPNDPEGVWPIVDCNEVACAMNGYTRDELIGRSIDLINTTPADAAERQGYLRSLRHQGVLHRDGFHRHKDGHIFPIEVSSSLISFAGRELVLGIDRNITERKQAEEDLKHAKEAAEAAQRVAEAASRAKSEFLSRMSHELRTPMNAILGFAQLLELSQKEPLSASQKERVKQITKGGQHLLDLINEILDISRIEANRMHVSPEPVSVRESVQEALDLSVPLAVKRHIQIVTRLGGLDVNPFVLADRQRFKQVLLNLLSNAVKYNHDGGSVIITCQAVAAKKWRISVADSGPGIAEGNLARLFIPFERLNEDQPNVEGTGLGLVLAKRLVELMHGQMGVESRLGKGTTFWFELPSTESPLEHAHLTNSTGRLPALSTNARTVLYVEDNVANFELIQQVLADYSQIKLIWAADAKAGIEATREDGPDLILLDLHLGGSDGADLLKQLKQNKETAGIPVIVVSADATSGQARRLTALGAYTYLTKPLDVKQFIQLVEEILGEKEM